MNDLDPTTQQGQVGLLVDGRYRLAERLGRGGMADVHRAHDEVLGRDVAVKLVRGAPDEDVSEASRRQVEEARIAARVAHPGLVTIFDSGTHDGDPYLVMQLLEGVTLDRLLVDGPLPGDAVRRLAAGLAPALAVVHAAGIVHRDLKPANVMVDGGRDHPVPTLTDFGISRLLDAVGHTLPGTVVGTARYLSPEQVRGGEAQPASDVYALGLVLLECLTGQHPFPGTQEETLVARVHRGPIVPTSLGPRWTRLVSATTQDDPDRRPTAAEVAHELDGWDDGRRPAVTSRHTEAEATGPTPVVVTSSPLPHPDLPPPRRGRRRAGLLAVAAVGVAAVAGGTWLAVVPSVPGDGGPAAVRETTAPEAVTGPGAATIGSGSASASPTPRLVSSTPRPSTASTDEASAPAGDADDAPVDAPSAAPSVGVPAAAPSAPGRQEQEARDEQKARDRADREAEKAEQRAEKDRQKAERDREKIEKDAGPGPGAP
ncbi:MAG: protein kinase [Nocardioidaceae bacterium]|nr:protein kinase [Nocardioidaceae bacterium]